VDAPLTREKLHSQELLHRKLLAASTDLIGVDIDQGGIDVLRDTIGGEYLCQDLSVYQSSPAVSAVNLFGFEPELYVLGDVIEHLHEPVPLLQGVGALASKSGADILISTPNALAVRTFINTTLGYELMHPEHVLVHSPTTLARLIQDAGLALNSLDYYNVKTGEDWSHRLYDIPSRALSTIRPAWADGLIATCTFSYQ